MSIGIKLEIKGLEELQKKLQKEVMLKPFHEGIKKATLLLQRETMMATVVDTGRLRASITPKLASDFGQVRTNVQYAQSVEYGTQTMEARHMEGGTKVLGKGMFAYALERLKDKMAGLLGDVANAIEAKWH
ncbi:hypothetical protein ES703_09106 [subsurface metagenome]